jgi:hypothetical protein
LYWGKKLWVRNKHNTKIILVSAYPPLMKKINCRTKNIFLPKKKYFGVGWVGTGMPAM